MLCKWKARYGRLEQIETMLYVCRFDEFRNGTEEQKFENLGRKGRTFIGFLLEYAMEEFNLNGARKFLQAKRI